MLRRLAAASPAWRRSDTSCSDTRIHHEALKTLTEQKVGSRYFCFQKGGVGLRTDLFDFSDGLDLPERGQGSFRISVGSVDTLVSAQVLGAPNQWCVRGGWRCSSCNCCVSIAEASNSGVGFWNAKRQLDTREPWVWPLVSLSKPLITQKEFLLRLAGCLAPDCPGSYSNCGGRTTRIIAADQEENIRQTPNSEASV